jgi:hypothetical protein
MVGGGAFSAATLFAKGDRQMFWPFNRKRTLSSCVNGLAVIINDLTKLADTHDKSHDKKTKVVERLTGDLMFHKAKSGEARAIAAKIGSLLDPTPTVADAQIGSPAE